MKKILIILVLLAIPLFFLFRSQDTIKGDNKTNLTHLIVFSTPTCPHCKIVKEFFSNKNIAITIKEVTNTEVQNEFIDTVGKCSPPQKPEETGVPLLFDPDSNACIMGSKPIIDYLEPKLLP